jgi:dihydroorotate dehydrogenase electron transfer subunit
MNKQNFGTVLSNIKLTPDIHRIKVQLDNMPKIVHGQFLNIKVPNSHHILRRPFGIAEFSNKNSTVDFCFQVRGGGTQALATLVVGQRVDVMLPLGNGFPIVDPMSRKMLGMPTLSPENQRVMIIAGGLGTFPLLPTAVANSDNAYVFLGFRKAQSAVMIDDYKQYTPNVIVASDDGSVGVKGFITDIARAEFDRIKPDVIFACGPNAMFRSLQRVFTDVDVPIYISLEERMACGFGACLCCNAKIQSGEEVTTKRICCEGPVFLMKEVVL